MMNNQDLNTIILNILDSVYVIQGLLSGKNPQGPGDYSRNADYIEAALSINGVLELLTSEQQELINSALVNAKAVGN